MIPLQDLNPRRNPPIITWLLIIINLLVFFYVISLPAEVREIFFRKWGFVPARFFDEYFWILTGGSLTERFLPLFTHMFIHGGWLHLISNLWTLWIFGDNVEDRLGPLRFLFFYFACGLAAVFLHSFFYTDSIVPIVGASGAISGVLGAYFLLFPLARILVLVPIIFIPLFIEVPAFLYLGFWFLMQFYNGLFSLVLPETFSSIAWFAHLGGFVFGIIGFKFFCPRRCRYYHDEYSIFGSLFDLDKWR